MLGLERGPTATARKHTGHAALLHKCECNLVKPSIVSETTEALGLPATGSCGTSIHLPAESLRRSLYLGEEPQGLHTVNFPPKPRDGCHGREPTVLKKEAWGAGAHTVPKWGSAWAKVAVASGTDLPRRLWQGQEPAGSRRATALLVLSQAADHQREYLLCGLCNKGRPTARSPQQSPWSSPRGSRALPVSCWVLGGRQAQGQGLSWSVLGEVTGRWTELSSSDG